MMRCTEGGREAERVFDAGAGGVKALCLLACLDIGGCLSCDGDGERDADGIRGDNSFFNLEVWTLG